MLLVDRGKVRLDAAVATYVPESSGSGTAAITVRHLLTHTSGLRATLPLYRDARDAPDALRIVFAERPVVPPGTRVIYSDLNAILLGEIVRRASGESLDAFASREVLGPLGLEHTLFRPPPALRPRIAPTGAWHGHPVAGVVNDQNAAKLGGVAGHAGLFGTATDLARFAQFMLRRGALPDGRHLVTLETVRLFTTKAVDFGRGTEARALGWQAVPTGSPSSRSRTRNAWRLSASRSRRSPRRCISCFPTDACSPAPTQRPSCCGSCRESAGSPGRSRCRAYCPSRGGSTRGSPAGAAAWCVATRLASLAKGRSRNSL